MEATLCLSKLPPLFTSQVKGYKPTITNHHLNVSFHHLSSYPPGSNLGEYLSMGVGVGAMFRRSSSGPLPEIVGAMSPGRRKSTAKRRRVPSWRSLTLESIKRGHLPLDLLLEAKKARIYPPFLDCAISQFDELLQKDRIPFDELKAVARKLEMSGNEDEAVKMLNDTLNRIYSQHKGGEEIFELKLLLAEMLIYQGEYEEARNICKEIDEAYYREATEAMESSPYFNPTTSVPVERFGPSNSLLLLFQAVTSALLEDMDTASGHWESFKSMSSVTRQPKEEPTQPSLQEPPEEDDVGEVKKHVLNFSEFLDHVRVFKDEIEGERQYGL